ncbi:Gfo/Idh/MocA family oxidoreductase [Microbacterium sp.]|uniref:Gfo/Idh/MocA family protein n=1 Tax=Microbacterium sp. TaxID=51671 RepID=UPI0028A94679|nr:Gfo/Idh/MocA family oxidoreductase [Microbacterium sp.]
MTHSAEPEPLVVGLVGAGGISQVHAAAWKQLGAHVLVHSLAGAEALAARHGLEVVGSLDELLERAEIVDIVTPTHTHEEVALAAIAVGRNIVCEKPLTLSAEATRRVHAAAQAAGVQIYPAHVVRYMAPYVRAKVAVDAGRIGTVAVARFFREGSSPADGTWFQNEAESGGVIMDLMLHDLDQARWICGEVESVYAVQNPPSVDGISPPFVSAHVSLTHAGGAISHMNATWGALGTVFKTGFSLAGDRGVLEYSSLQNTGLVLEAQGQDEGDLTIPEAAVRESPYLTELRDFAESFRTGRPARVNAEDGAMAVYLAQAAQQSLRTGAVVTMSEFAEQRVSDPDSAHQAQEETA